jgi:cobyrinic acid a,c-diamide synthase
MVGALPCEIEMTNKPQGHGYVTAEVDAENPFFPKGTILRGHEFHNSRIVNVPPDTAYRLSRGSGLGDGRDGIVLHNVLASYTHLHVGGCAAWVESLVKRARLFRESLQPANE